MTGRGLRYGGHWNLRNNISDEFQILDFETSFAGSFIAVVEEIVNTYLFHVDFHEKGAVPSQVTSF